MIDGIKLNNVSLERGGNLILENIDVAFNEKHVGIIGRNGSGKSSLARLFNSLFLPTKGQVEIFGIDSTVDSKAILRNVGMIFQNPDHQIIFPTVIEELAFGLEQQGEGRDQARDKALALLAQYGRQNWADKPTHSLSQGQRHLICLLAVLVMQPKLIIFDEPYAGLDIPTARQMHALIDTLTQHVVMITHDPTVLKNFDRLLWLERGRLVGNGTVEEVLPSFMTTMDEMTRNIKPNQILADDKI